MIIRTSAHSAGMNDDDERVWPIFAESSGAMWGREQKRAQRGNSILRMLSSTLKNASRPIASFPRPLATSEAQKSTVYALSTPPGKGGVAIVRVSGPDALAVWKDMVRSRSSVSHPQPWRMEHCRIVKPSTSFGSEDTLDNGLAVFFKGTILLILVFVVA